MLAYLVPDTADDTKYILYLQADGLIVAGTSCKRLFYYFTSLESIGGLENFDTSKVTNMSWMFFDCKNLKTLNLSNFNVSSVTDSSFLFLSILAMFKSQ